MLDSRRPYFLPVHHIIVTVPDSRRADPAGIGTRRGLRHPKGLQAQLTGGYPWQQHALLVFRAVTQYRAHCVHLGMTCPAIASGSLDLLKYGRALGNTKTRSPVFLRDQASQKARLGQLLDKFRRIGPVTIFLPPVFTGKTLTQLANRVANVLMAHVHALLPSNQGKVLPERCEGGNQTGTFISQIEPERSI